MNKEQNILAGHFSTGTLLRFALPTILMMVLMGLYTVVDTIFVSHFVSTDAFASINIVCPVLNLTVGLGTMLATGGNAIISKYMGEGRERKAKESFTLIFFTGAGLGLFLAGAGLLWREKLLYLLGAEGMLFGYARDYLTILLFFLPANILQTLFANLFVTAGRPGLGSMLSIGAGILNIILDYIFIVLCHMGIQGAALGTGIGYLMPALVGGVYFCVKRQGTLCFVRPKWNAKILLESCFNGSSEMVSQLATAVTTLLFNRTMMRLAGEDGVAAITIIIYSQFLLSTVYIGFSMGVAPVIGYNYGSGETKRQKQIFRICMGFVWISSAVVFLFSFLGGQYMVQLFAGQESTVYAIASEGFRIFAFSFLFCGQNIYTSAFFTALSNGRVSAFLSFFRTFVFLTTGILFLPKLWGITGVWLAVPAAEGIAWLFSMASLRKYRFVP